MLQIFANWGASYRRFFAIDEIEKSVRLQLVFLALWFVAVFDLAGTSDYPYPKDTNICWSYWNNCTDYFQINGFPYSYSYTIWMAAVLAFLLTSIWALANKRWSLAHFFFFIVIVWKFVQSFVLSTFHTTNFELFHLIPAFALLLTRNKISSLRYTWALAYLFAAHVKLDDAWIVGTYFSSMKLGLPLIPKFMIPVATNIVIVGEIFLSVGLIFPNTRIQRVAFWTWTTFHIYSAIIVGYYYPIRCLAALWTIFGMPEKDPLHEDAPTKAYSKGTFAIVAIIIIMNFFPSMVSENPNVTFEGVDYGFYMINSNYQCVHEITRFNIGGKNVGGWKKATRSPMRRCYPQDILQSIKRECKTLLTGEKLHWTFLESRNGGPFYELIHEDNACTLEYNAFGRNEWIHMPADSRIVGYPEKNMMGEQGEPKILKAPPEQKEISFLQKYYEQIKFLYTFLWYCSFIYILCFLFQFHLPFLKRIRMKK